MDPIKAAVTLLPTTLLRRFGRQIARQALHLLSAGRMLLDHLLGEVADFLVLCFLLRQLRDLDLIAGLAIQASSDLLIAARGLALALLTLLRELALLARLTLLTNLSLLQRLLSGLP